MRLGGQRAGHLTLFIDSACEEVLLKVLVDPAGYPLIAFKLYDANGQLVIDSPEPAAFPEGLCVKAPDDELLLQIPSQQGEALMYRLYSREGTLLTASDGQRTQIFASLRMAGKAVAPFQAKGPSSNGNGSSSNGNGSNGNGVKHDPPANNVHTAVELPAEVPAS